MRFYHIYVMLPNLICWTLVPYLLSRTTNSLNSKGWRNDGWWSNLDREKQDTVLCKTGMHWCRDQDKADSKVSTCSEMHFVGGWGRIPRRSLRDEDIGKPTPLPRTKARGEGKACGVRRATPLLTWLSSSWPSPSWRWKRAAQSGWAGGGAV